MRLLDTNVLRELVRRRPDPAVLDELRRWRSDRIFACAITRFELRYAASLHVDGERFWHLLQTEVLPVVTWLSVTQEVAERAGVIAAELRRQSRACGMLDPLIAATALEHGMPLVTRNIRHFESIRGLTLENWFAPA